MEVLHLTLKKKWFDMIASGEKKEEYREIKGYWEKRFIDDRKQTILDATTENEIAWKEYDLVSANNGYSKGCPNIKWKHEGIRIGKPNPLWCEPEDVDKTVFILKIGQLI